MYILYEGFGAGMLSYVLHRSHYFKNIHIQSLRSALLHCFFFFVVVVFTVKCTRISACCPGQTQITSDDSVSSPGQNTSRLPCL